MTVSEVDTLSKVSEEGRDINTQKEKERESYKQGGLRRKQNKTLSEATQRTRVSPRTK